MGYLVLSAMLLSALLPGGREKASDPYAGFNEITLDQPSDHVSWGIPLASGPVHSLFLAPRFALRDMAELAQRVELRCDAVPLWDAGHFGAPEAYGSIPGATAQDTLELLNERLGENWDLIVAGNFDLAQLPEEQLKAILAKVDACTGLILVNFRDGTIPPILQAFIETLESQEAPSIVRGIGETLTPEWKSGFEFVTAAKHGSGRVVLLDYPSARPQSHFLLPGLTRPMEAETEHADIYYSLVAKACLWAAGRDGGAWIERVEPYGMEGPAAEEIPPIFPEEYVKRMQEGGPVPDLVGYRVLLNKPADETYAVRVQVRQPGRRRTVAYTTYETSIPLRKGDSSYTLNLPLGAGTHYLDLWLLDKDRVVDWHTAVLEVKGWPTVEGLKFNKETLQPNDTLGIAFEIPSPIHPDLIKNRRSIVFARAIDSLQRIVAMSTREVEGLTAEVSLDLDFADLVTSRVKVEVYVLGAPIGVSGINREPSEFELNRAAFAYRWFPVRQQLDPHAFTFVATGGASSEYNVRTAYRTLQSLGVDTVETWANDADAFFGTEAALRVLPRLTSYADATVDDALRRSPCLSDPAFLRSDAAEIEEASRSPWVEGVGRYSLGDGNRLTDGGRNACQSDTCLQGFRSRLEAEYGTMERLQAAWQSYAGEWSALKPLPLADATASGVYPPWVDFRQYMDAVFTSAHTMARDIVRVQAPKTRIGFASMPAPGLYSGYAWSQLASELNLLGVPPDSLAVDKVRSYRGENSTALLMCGEGFSPLDETHVRWIPWYAALHGFSGVWYNGALGSVESASPAVALLPDARPMSAFHALADEMALLRQGIAAVLLRASRPQASIAVYDSAASRYLNAAETSFGVDSPAAETAITNILKSLGFAFDYVSPDTDSERLKQYRLLVLPMARALSDAEVEVVRAFHANGGHLLADIAPASFDEHGTRRAAPALADLFGAKWDGPSRSNESAADAAVKPDGAEARSTVGEVPLWLYKKNGEAWAVLINQALPAGAETDSKWIESFRSALAETGAVPAVSFEEPFRGECSVLQYGKATLYGLLRAPEGGEDVETVALNLGKGYAFDLRQGLPVARKKATFRLQRGEAALVARLPYDVLELELGAPQAVAPGRRIPLHLTLKTRGGLPGEHVVRVEFGPAGGAPLRHYGRDVICKDGNADAYIALSQRERPGLYNLIAWDALTGLSAQTTVRIESEPIPEH